MYIAKKLKEKSIAEYLLYMWQMEDLIRAYGCSLPRIRKEYIDKFDYTPEQKDEEADWFGNLIRMMNEEGCREKGHLQINQVIIGDLFDLHCQLLDSNKVELRQKGDKNVNEIETCLDALYGVMMLRLQQKEISPETDHAIKEISTFIGMLSDYYIKDRTEGIDFGEQG